MFRKVIESLSRSLSASKKTANARPRRGSGGSVLEAMVQSPGRPASPAAGNESAEQLCGIQPGMSRDEIMALLKKLYRRHNRAASSLNPALRAESERMLDAIVEVREKHFGRI